MTNDDKSGQWWGGASIVALACLFAGACGGMTGDADDAQGSGGSVGSGGTPGSGGTVAGSGGTPGMTECVTSAECTVGYPGCCAPCEPVTAENLGAYNGSWFSNRPLCDIACAPCAEVEELERQQQYFVAQCVEGECALLDIRDEYTECNTGEDCVLYNGNGCCNECDDTGFIAVSSFEFLDDKCETLGTCAPCVPTVPDGLSAQCSPSRHCEVVQK